jgi:hypothetical protein
MACFQKFNSSTRLTGILESCGIALIYRKSSMQFSAQKSIFKLFEDIQLIEQFWIPFGRSKSEQLSFIVLRFFSIPFD